MKKLHGIPFPVSARPCFAWAAAVVLAVVANSAVRAAEPAAIVLDKALTAEVERFAAADMARLPPNTRVELRVGQLDPRLTLAPCQQVQPYLPPNTRLWGRTRIGLRCVRGPKAWNVYLPISVDVYAKALVATAMLPAGSVLSAADLATAEVNVAQEQSPALTEAERAVGRTLARPLSPGQGVLQSHLAPRKWFAAGDTVRITTVGNGFKVTASGEALNAGLEGQRVRVRTEGGRIVTGEAVGERQVEVAM